MTNTKIIDCTTCKYGYEDEQLGIPMCHHPKRFSEDCVDFNMHEEKPVPNDLQEYASRAGFDYVDNIVQEHPGHRFNDHDVEFAYRDGIIAGAKWQKEQTEKRWLEDRDGCFWDGVEEGKKAMKEQMLKEAVEGEVVKDINNKLAVTAKNVNLDKFKFGDKVRVIILKKED